MRLLLIRHGYSLHTQRNLIAIDTCPGLAAEGRAQAAKLAARLASSVEAQGARLISSPAARARQTAEALAAALHLEIEDSPDLRELIPGEADGMSYVARYGACAPAAGRIACYVLAFDSDSVELTIFGEMPPAATGSVAPRAITSIRIDQVVTMTL